MPQTLGTKKETAEVLHAAWQRRLGGGELVHTRSQEGRRTLLRARVRALSGAFAGSVDRLDRWA